MKVLYLCSFGLNVLLVSKAFQRKAIIDYDNANSINLQLFYPAETHGVISASIRPLCDVTDVV